MMMTSVPGTEYLGGFVRNEGGQITEANLQSYFDIVRKYVLTQADYMCPMKYLTWIVTKWCKHLDYNAIKKKGSDNDKTLVESYKTIYNNHHNQKMKMKQSNIQVNVQRKCVGNIQGMHIHIYMIINLFLSIQG